MSDFVAFLLYVNLFMKPMFRLTVFTEMYQRGMAGFHRFQEVMAVEPDIVDAEDVVPDWPIKGEIAFENILCQRKLIETIKENTIEAFLQKETKINKNMSYYYFHNNFGFSKEIFYGVFDYYTGLCCINKFHPHTC